MKFQIYYFYEKINKSAALYIVITLFLLANGLLATSPRNVICEVTFSAESSSVSNNIKLQIFQKSFQDAQLFSTNPIKCLNVYADI